MNRLQLLGCDKLYDESEIVVFGAPYDGTTSFKPGTRFAPNAIRLDSDAIETYSPYQNKDLEDMKISDIGDIELSYGEKNQVLDELYNATKKILNDDKTPFMIGGEHLVTYPAFKAVYEKYPNCQIIHFDAHTDLRQEFSGGKFSHASVMKRIHDLIGDNKIYQFGIRSGLKEEFQFAEKHNYIEKFSANTIKDILHLLNNKPVYITIDLDVLDPSIMPGTGTPEAGGLTFKELHNAILSLKGLNIVGADVVELSPEHDPSKSSNLVATKVIRELLMII
ncbi:agmatinase [Candidatus Izimaplasma bacterium ZiA1]|uniref:agmatinase n=1 Tax=Candidatus Izimoplasma sp. ZiA1 TaxID=2024899 RepID=UPI000BAA8362|nr:agmatinase [Candidatus Izimaplasma bacterium ZiA1]